MPIETLRVVLGDQLSRSIAALSDLDVERNAALMAEIMANAARADWRMWPRARDVQRAHSAPIERSHSGCQGQCDGGGAAKAANTFGWPPT